MKTMTKGGVVDRDQHSPTPQTEAPVWLWPSLRRVAEIIRVDAGWLSKRNLPTQRCGQEKRMDPELVLQLGDEYRRRDIGEIAAALVEYARPRANSREELSHLETRVSRYLAGTRNTARATPGDQWLAEAKRRLPADLYRRVVNTTSGDIVAPSFEGTRFDEDDY